MDLSATFDTVNHQIILSTITGSALHWVNLISQVVHSLFSGAERYPKNINWPQGFLRDQFLGPNYTSTWFLLPLLCWWHTALSLISTRQPNSSGTDLRLPGKHLGMDEGHHLQINLAKTELLVFPATPTLQHDFIILLGTSKIILWWPADLHGPYCKDSSIMQLCIAQHQKEQALPNRASCTTSCPGPCYL